MTCDRNIQGNNVVDVAKTKASTAPEAAGYILEFTHGEADPRYVVINGSTCAHHPRSMDPVRWKLLLEGACYRKSVHGGVCFRK